MDLFTKTKIAQVLDGSRLQLTEQVITVTDRQRRLFAGHSGSDSKTDFYLRQS